MLRFCRLVREEVERKFGRSSAVLLIGSLVMKIICRGLTESVKQAARLGLVDPSEEGDSLSNSVRIAIVRVVRILQMIGEGSGHSPSKSFAVLIRLVHSFLQPFHQLCDTWSNGDLEKDTIPANILENGISRCPFASAALETMKQTSTSELVDVETRAHAVKSMRKLLRMFVAKHRSETKGVRLPRNAFLQYLTSATSCSCRTRCCSKGLRSMLAES